jgi:hypothetical protein
MLVKLPLLPNVAHANVVHQEQLVIQAKTAKMATPVPMENQEAQASMLNPTKNNFSQFHPNASAMLHQAAQANQDQKDPTVAQAMLEHQAVMVNQDQQDHQAHLAQLVKPELTDQKDPTANQEYKKKALQAQQAQSAKLALQEPQDQQDQQVVQAKMVNQAPPVVQEMLVHQVQLANLVPQVLQETMVPQVPLALALTAHQLVWLQVIKRSNGNYNNASRIIIIDRFSHKMLLCIFCKTTFMKLTTFLFKICFTKNTKQHFVTKSINDNDA